MKHERIETDKLNSEDEEAGLTQRSILSAILTIYRDGANLQNILAMKYEIDGLTATMWSLIALSATINPDSPKQNALLAEQVQQAHRIFNRLLSMTEEMANDQKAEKTCS